MIIELNLLARVQGSILGLAIGDALGYPHEFRSVEQVQRELGPAGITGYLSPQDARFTRPIFLGTRHPPGTYTDDTQMSIAVAEALLEAGLNDTEALMRAMGRHFVTWYFSDENNRSPGATTGQACTHLQQGASWREAGIAGSKGCGSVMRVAPIGLVSADLDWVCETARLSSLLTHGHPTAIEACAAGALLVSLAAHGATDPERMFAEVERRVLGRDTGFDACFSRLPEAVLHRPRDALVHPRGDNDAYALGEGWIAEEAIASAFYCFWRHPRDFRACVLEGVNTDGDSDSIASIAGGIAGAALGIDAIPSEWRSGVENSGLLHELAERLAQL
jgi:ADP-ribosylglycohydrolase